MSAKQDPCHEFREILPLYAVGAASDEQARRLESRLPECPELQRELAEYRAVTHALMTRVPDAGSVPPVDALLARVRRYEQTAAHMPAPVIVPAPHQAPRRWPMLAAAAILILLMLAVGALIAANLHLITQVGALRDEQVRLANLLTAPTPANLFNVRRDGQDHHRELNVNVADAPQDASAIITWNSQDRIGALFVTHMPAPPEGHAYQLWVVGAGESDVMSLGMFSVDERGAGTLTFKADKPLESFAAVGITLEPITGSAHPTTPHMLIGQL